MDRREALKLLGVTASGLTFLGGSAVRAADDAGKHHEEPGPLPRARSGEVGVK